MICRRGFELEPEPLSPLGAVTVCPCAGAVVLLGDANRTSDLHARDGLVALVVINGNPGQKIAFRSIRSTRQRRIGIE